LLSLAKNIKIEARNKAAEKMNRFSFPSFIESNSLLFYHIENIVFVNEDNNLVHKQNGK